VIVADILHMTILVDHDAADGRQPRKKRLTKQKFAV